MKDDKNNCILYLDKKFKNNDKILKLLTSNVNNNPVNNNHQLFMTNCKPLMKIIYCKNGGICVYCKTWFKIITSLTDHQKKCCR